MRNQESNQARREETRNTEETGSKERGRSEEENMLKGANIKERKIALWSKNCKGGMDRETKGERKVRRKG